MLKLIKGKLFRVLIFLCLFICIFSNAKKISFLDKLKKKNPEDYINYLKSISLMSLVDFKYDPNALLRSNILKIIYNKEIDVANKSKHFLYELRKSHVLNLEWIVDNKNFLFQKVFSRIHSQGIRLNSLFSILLLFVCFLKKKSLKILFIYILIMYVLDCKC